VGTEERSTRRTIGLLVRRIDLNQYDKGLWKAAYEVAREQSDNLILFTGHSSFSADPRDRVYSAIYNTLNPRLLDGAILSQTVSLWMSEDELSRFASELPAIPLVSTSIKIGDRPCLFIDNDPGLRMLMRHLIEVHGCRRVVHVRGPRSNKEAQEREDVWRQELRLAGIEPLDSWLVQGHFIAEELDTIGHDLMERTGGEFDAVVACNDTAAFRVIEDLRSMGYRVPGDFLVCGFDDISQCEFFDPPLTTVRQPTEEQLRAAWASLIELLDSGEAPPDSSLGTSLVLRSSCACPPAAWAADGFPAFEALRRRLAGAEGASGFAETPKRELFALAALEQSRITAIEERQGRLSEFDRAMNQVTEPAQLCDALREWLPKLGIPRFALLATCDSRGETRPCACEPSPGVLLPPAPEFFRVLATLPEGGFGEAPVLRGGELSLAPWLSLIEPFVLGSFPLVVAESWYGLLFLDLPRDVGLLERAIQEQTASVFHRLALEKDFLERNLEERTRTLVQTEKMITYRRLVSEVAHEINTPLGAIISSNSGLEEGLRELLAESPGFFSELGPESRGAYARLVRGSSIPRSDMSGLRTRERSRSLLKDLEACRLARPDKVAEELADIGWKGPPEELGALARVPGFEAIVERLFKMNDLAVSTRIIALAADKAARFVDELRGTAARKSSEEAVGVDARESLEAAILLLQGEVQRGVRVSWVCETVPLALCKPEDIQQVWINLLRNAFHSVGYKGQVLITVRSEPPWLRIGITDDGPGIDESLRSRIFAPFFTTKTELEGMGLGLSICRRIVEDAGGKIEFESAPGRTTFSVLLRRA
jgi:DNA-binding LacI/PurR family transcriptional regulator/signal transduction histidine kinase